MLQNRTAGRSMPAILIALAIAGYVATPTETLAISEAGASDRLECCAGFLCIPNQGNISVRLIAFRGNDQGRGTVQIGNIVHDADFVEGGLGTAVRLEWRWKGGQARFNKDAKTGLFIGSYQIAGQGLAHSLRCVER